VESLFSVTNREKTVKKALQTFIQGDSSPGQPGGWRFDRIRPDKVDPNYITVAINTLDSIHHGISKERLLVTCNELKPKPVGSKRRRESE